MQDWEKNLKERGPKRLAQTCSLLKGPEDLKKVESENFIFKSPCDLGVIRNGGKRGAKHGPQAIMAPFLSMVAPQSKKDCANLAPTVYSEMPTSSRPEDFDKVQANELNSFHKLFGESSASLKKLCHIGGGHDHVYPLGAALQQSHGPLVIINIDAHLDTRPDTIHHSGTPFRQLLNEGGKDLTLLQLGIHNFANGKPNYENLPQMEVIPWSLKTSPHDIKATLKEKLKVHADKEATLVLSVDCDGLDASYMPAVSAPNHSGLSQEQFLAILEACSEYWSQSSRPQVLGLYEFNPIYDNLAQAAARFMAQVMYRFFYGVKESHA